MNIFVANINFKTTPEALEEAFGAHGQVTSVKIVTDRQSGRSKGYGFVEMASDEEGNRVIAALNGQMLDDRELVVKPANNSNG